MSYVENIEQQPETDLMMQQQIQSDFERAKVLIQAIYGSDSEACEAFMQRYDSEDNNDIERLIVICDEAIVICSDPHSPYYQFAIRKRLMEYGCAIASTKDTGLRMRHLNVCAEYVRSRLSNKSLASELVSMLYLRIVTKRDNPVDVVASVIKQLPKGPQSELFKIKKRYLGFGSEPILESSPS